MSASGGRRELFAIVASLLMIVSILPAGTVSAGTVTETAGNTAPADPVPDVSMDGPPVILKAQAMGLIKNFSASSNQLEAAKDRARSRLNDSFAYYQDPTRIDDQHAFIRDAEVLRALTDFDGTNQSKRLDQIVELVATADNQSARQVIRDAEYAFTATEADLGPGMTNSVEAHIDNARRQLARAERIRDRAAEKSGAQSIRTTARAVRTYGSAVNQAHTALGMIDDEVSPKVSLTRRTDPIRNGSQQAQYTLVGNVTNPTGLDAVNVTATINDDRTVDLPVRGGYANATFAGTINLTERVNTIEIAAVESTDNQQSNNGKQKSKQKGKKKGKKKGNSGASSGQNQASTVVLRLDGDGLPDTYEKKVTGTDPLDPDSDAPSTDVNEADNGTIDGHEDFDGDRLSTIRERELGTDPLEADTDGDDLPDGFEEFVIGTDPLDADTDDDGTPDGEEDLDGDGLTNAEEYDAETSPQYADIDGDGLTDPQELAKGTDPWQADTDDDGLDDGVEPTDPFNTDPLDPDTDRNGIEDGNETYTTTAGNESLGVDVELTGQGNVAGGVTVGEETERYSEGERVQNMSVSETVEIESTREFESANVTISYDDSLPAASNESDLAVVTYDPEKQLYVPINSTIDAENNTVTAQTEHFSTFAVFSISNWADDVTAERPSNGTGGEETIQPVDVQFIIDSSGSMGWNDPQEFRKQAAKEFVGALVPGDRAGVVDFDGDAHVAQQLTTDFGAVNVTIENLDAAGGTNIGAGVARANQHFASASNDTRAKVAILLTDGQGSGGRAQARTAADRNITIHTIGFGGADGTKLSDIATITNGTYNYVEDASELPNVFSRVAEEVEPKDTDGDGLPDVLEENGLPIGHTGSDLRRLPTNATDKHTDGDELTDGEEAEEYREYPIDFVVNDLEHEYIVSYFELRSNPTRADSDGDGLEDHEEVSLENNSEADGWTIDVINESGQPYRWARSVEQSRDGTISVTSNPMLRDTDGDGLTDAEEKEETHTDPREDLTYSVADVPRGLVSDIKNGEQPVVYSRGHEGYNTRTRHFYEVSYGLLNLNQPEAPLTDATADYDFVTAGSAPQAGEGTYTVTEAWEKLTFRALDGTTRTDVAMSNAVELENDLDPWDPDSDDDGLTDGQEHNWLTHVPVDTGYVANHEVTHDRTLGTDPMDADTDGDGYWDGWLGVYNVDYSDNVILYRENLQSGNGIEGDERVDNQAGVHAVDSTEPGAYLDNSPGSSVKRHSNIHLGELHWQDFDPSQTADPTNSSVTPDPQLTVEVDYHSSIASEEIVNESLDIAERTYQLYGMDLSYVRDQNITQQEPFGGDVNIDELPDWMIDESNGEIHQELKTQYWEDARQPSPSFASNNEDINHDIEGSAYMFITHDGGGSGNWLIDEFDWTSDPSGVASCQGADLLCDQWAGGKLNFGTIVFHRDIAQDSGPYRIYGAKTIVHETGHLIGAGRNDDGSVAGLIPEEVYSGSSDDTEEWMKLGSDTTKRWSVMSSGWTSEIMNQPMNGRYIPYSIEELLTIEFNNIDAMK